MKRGIKYNLILLFYSWCIYNLWLFIMAPYFIKKMGILQYGIYAILTLSAYYDIYFLFNSLDVFFTGYAIIPLFFFFAGGLTLFLWWRKQTIIRAWLLSLAGMLFGPGLIFCIVPYMRFGPPERAGFYGLLALNIIYLFILVGNFLQKRFWPQNRFINNIRNILQRPCIRI